MGQTVATAHVTMTRQNSLLLRLPQELLLMILRESFKDQLSTCCKKLHFSRGGWLPPPILQVCHELRVIGAEEWLSMEGVHDIDNFDATDIIGRDKWFMRIKERYHISRNRQRTVIMRQPTDAAAAKQNLLVWLEDNHHRGREGLFMATDFDDNDSTWLRLNGSWYTVPVAYDPRVIRCRVSKLFLAAYRMKVQGASWAKVRDAIEPSLDLVLL